MPDLVETPCPACGDDRHRRAHEVEAEPPAPRGPWRIARCLGCASDYLRPRPADPAALYGPGYHVHRPPGKLEAKVRRVLATLEASRLARMVGRPAGHVFEVGCGTGETLLALKRRGFEVSGIEVSIDAARLARARGLAVEEGGFEGGRGVASEYDLVLLAHVLEHVASPRRVLAEARRILRPGGKAVIKAPVAGSWDAAVLGGYSGAFDVPYHLLVPSRPALRAMAAEAGLELVAERADPVPNDWVHGLRKAMLLEFGLPLPFVQPWNPLIAFPLLPLSLLAALCGGAGRLRLVLRKPEA